LIGLAVTGWGARGRGSAKLQAFCRLLSRPWGWIVALVILYVGGVIPEIPGGPIVFYLFVFLLGFIAVCDPQFMESAQRYRVPMLVAGLGLALFHVLSSDFRESFPDPSWQRALLYLAEIGACWFTIVGMLGFARRYLDRTSRTQRYLAEGSYPAYILHQTVIVIIGTFALYELVRRVNVLRFLFGMKWLKTPDRGTIPHEPKGGRRRRRAASIGEAP
jgi:peptidoglycan/LPS O-acetylase OafA/YrhL